MQRPHPASGADVTAMLSAAGLTRGGLLAVSLSERGAGLAVGDRRWALDLPAAVSVGQLLGPVEHELRPRWVWWSARQTARALVGSGMRPALCWDVAEVHRLLAGGGPDDPAHVWAWVAGLDPAGIPRTGQLDLWGEGDRVEPGQDDRPEDPTTPQGYLRAEWADGGWSRSPERLARWAALSLQVQERQVATLGQVRCSGEPVSTAAGESAAALLCAELEHDGLPVDRDEVERILASSIGPRPHDLAHEAALRRRRDETVLAHLPATTGTTDLRHPGQVRAALAQVGIDLPDTRSWRLEPWRGQHPLVGALLDWRRADRLATTYGYRWLDEHVGPDGRLRGGWRASDGAAGRMTAQAGLHNLPAELRPGVVAEPGHVFVRADLGQVEPRVLAAISADRALAHAAAQDDLYAPVAARLQVDRPVAKVAVLAAMYGQTSGTAGQALAGLQAAYPVAMRFLSDAYDRGWSGQDVRTHGGRVVHMPAIADSSHGPARQSALASRGRYARNAVVQGSAAELFKQWAVTVRSSIQPLEARIVLCLHDELLLHVPQDRAQEAGDLLTDSLAEVAARWAPRSGVRFVAEVSVVRRWSQAKG